MSFTVNSRIVGVCWTWTCALMSQGRDARLQFDKQPSYELGVIACVVCTGAVPGRRTSAAIACWTEESQDDAGVCDAAPSLPDDYPEEFKALVAALVTPSPGTDSSTSDCLVCVLCVWRGWGGGVIICRSSFTDGEGSKDEERETWVSCGGLDGPGARLPQDVVRSRVPFSFFCR